VVEGNISAIPTGKQKDSEKTGEGDKKTGKIL
jgi:hypothetical protein